MAPLPPGSRVENPACTARASRRLRAASAAAAVMRIALIAASAVFTLESAAVSARALQVMQITGCSGAAAARRNDIPVALALAAFTHVRCAAAVKPLLRASTIAGAPPRCAAVITSVCARAPDDDDQILTTCYRHNRDNTTAARRGDAIFVGAGLSRQAPRATTLIDVTPAGTTNDCLLPTKWNVLWYGRTSPLSLIAPGSARIRDSDPAAGRQECRRSAQLKALGKNVDSCVPPKWLGRGPSASTGI